MNLSHANFSNNQIMSKFVTKFRFVITFQELSWKKSKLIFSAPYLCYFNAYIYFHFN